MNAEQRNGDPRTSCKLYFPACCIFPSRTSLCSTKSIRSFSQGILSSPSPVPVAFCFVCLFLSGFVCGRLAVFPSCSQFPISEAMMKDTLNVSSAEYKVSLTSTSTGEGSPHSPLPNTVQDTISLTCGQGTLLVHFQLWIHIAIIPYHRCKKS